MAVFIGGIGATSKKLRSLTSNQYYKGLNNRYDKRLKKLMKMGLKLNREYMMWHKSDMFNLLDAKNHRYMTNEFVMHSDDRALSDKLDRIK